MALYYNGKACGNAERGYREHTLWQGSTTPATSGTDITLNDAISNYDEIVFEIDKGTDSYGGQNRFCVSLLTIGENYISTIYDTSYKGAYWTYTSDTAINIKSQSSNHTQTYTRIIGIKYSEAVAGSSFHKYSTTERVVGEWVDGSTIYEKTVYIAALPNATTTEYETGLSNITPISFDNILIFQSGNTSKAPYLNMNSTVWIAIQFNANGKIYFGTNTNQSSTSAYVTLRYIKSSS